MIQDQSTSIPIKSIGDTGVTVSMLGFGAAALGNLYHAVPDAAALDTLNYAIDSGIRYVDTAPHYGQGLSERRVGMALGRRHEPVTISSKVGRRLMPVSISSPGTERHGFVDGDPFEPVFDYTYDGVMRAFEDSCVRLGRERIDILLAHDLGQATHGDAAEGHMKAFLESGYRAMHTLKAQGRVAAIGLGTNEWQVCEQCLEHVDLDVFLLAGRYTLLEQTALESFLPTCSRRQISIIVGGPYNSGILVEGVQEGKVPHYNYEPAPSSVIARVRALQIVCEAYGIPLAAAALQFPLAHPSVVSVIPGMAGPDQVTTNLSLFNCVIPEAFWAALKTEGLLAEAAPVPISGAS